MDGKKKQKDTDVVLHSGFDIDGLSITEIESYLNLCDYIINDLNRKRTLNPSNQNITTKYGIMFDLRNYIIDEILKRLNLLYDKMDEKNRKQDI